MNRQQHELLQKTCCEPGHSCQHRVCLMAGDRVARSVIKFIYIRVGGQILRIYPPLNKPKTLAQIL
jgi:hypothetical protein